ncbi:solute carrier family 13 member 5-like [Acanthaster planci]|uniref:Solute carrier family 13 member 5-like n=1 Tax=Acanthaster planci TaxID=133434 RepID=A0A8B7YIY1_ACAPL|nr:solute carrier family 13 member 5-like [Acanthaster planci]
MDKCKSVVKVLWAFRTTILLVLIPLLASPLLIVSGDSVAKCGWVVIVMAGYWTFEVVPLAVTSILPVLLFPLLGVQDSDDVCRNYLKDTNFLAMGGLMVAVAIQHWNLHRRIALGVLLLVGSQPRRLMLGFMAVTAFLSMWISNTATTAMMVPIVHSVLAQMVKKDGQKEDDTLENADAVAVSCDGVQLELEKGTQMPENNFSSQSVTTEEPNGIYKTRETDLDETDEKNADRQEGSSEDVTSKGDDAANVDIDFASLSPAENSMCKGMMLCVSAAASFGGTATLTGTGTNLVFNEVVSDLYGDAANINFASWIVFALPAMILSIFCAWFWLQFFFLDRSLFGCCRELRSCCLRKNHDAKAATIRAVIKKQYDALGPMSWAEVWVLIHFIALALLWFTKELAFIPDANGWAELFPVPLYVTDATAVVFICFLLFLFPSTLPNMFCWRDGTKLGPRTPLLTWSIVQKKLPWNVVLLLGGGFALADGCRESGLSQWLADQFKVLQNIPAPVLVLVITIVICIFTEFTSNVATATIFLPVLASLAESICVNPLYIMIPAALACSYAFMLPVATPPNAIVFSYGTITVVDMAKAGVVMNIIGLIMANGLINSLAIPMYDVFNYPPWAPNSTCLG